FIGQCIESVLAQTYQNWEQIIIDDGSTDRTGEIVARYEDERIKYIRQDNIGIWRLGESYNEALQISRGELIAVLEGDDFWPPDKLEKQISAFDREEVVLSWGKAAITNSDGKIIYISPNNLKWFRNRGREEVLRKLLLQNFIPACTAMCRKDALLSMGGFRQPDGVPYVDYPTWLELTLVGEFYAIDNVMGYWRRHKEQSSSVRIKQMAEGTRCSIDLFERLPKELRDSLDISVNHLLAKHKYNVASAYFALGRVALLEGKWKEARPNFKRAIEKGNFPTRTKALLGIVCSYVKINLEWAALLMRRPRLSKFL
ncbi:glycosyltransferase, partial [candidate division NPL-UPA2 bacterium Unc8]